MGKRLFVAADISEEARTVAAGLIASFRGDFPVKGISWSKPENLHVTIKFLGDTDESTRVQLSNVLSRVASSHQPFRLQFDKPELLGKRVISIAIRSDSPSVFSLEMVIDTECERLGFEREGRRFHPHLTLGRVRRPGGTQHLAKQLLETQIQPLDFEVREIVLYESELSAGGSIYRKLGTFPLMS